MPSRPQLSQQASQLSISDLPSLIVGSHTTVPTLNGPKRYINFDNAASTPTFKPIADSVYEFLGWYANVHRGTGFKSQLSSWAFEEARDIVAEFVCADQEKQIVLFTKNSTEAINKLSRRVKLDKGDIIITSLMEHHSNELPWRRVGDVKHIGINHDGTVDTDSFEQLLSEYGSKVKIVAITGASNVSGYINDIDYFARKAHSVGAKIVLDGAQLVPHRPVDVKANDPECSVDYLVFSAHKMYAPFGVGVLVADREIFEQGDPTEVGGGVVDIVTIEEAYWADLPDKEEAGTPDIVGVVALGQAIGLLKQIGWDSIIQHESELTAYALEAMAAIPEVTLYGDTDPSRAAQRLGVVSFNIGDIPHALTAAILSHEGGIGVRSGCFCAHTYVKELLHVSDERASEYEAEILARDRTNLPGAVRASFGIYNSRDEVSQLITMVKKIATGDYRKDYVLDKDSGSYSPPNFECDYSKYFSF